MPVAPTPKPLSATTCCARPPRNPRTRSPHDWTLLLRPCSSVQWTRVSSSPPRFLLVTCVTSTQTPFLIRATGQSAGPPRRRDIPSKATGKKPTVLHLCRCAVKLSPCHTTSLPTADWAPPLSTHTHTRRLHSLCRSWNSSLCHPKALVRDPARPARRPALRVHKATCASEPRCVPVIFEVWSIYRKMDKFSIYPNLSNLTLSRNSTGNGHNMVTRDDKRAGARLKNNFPNRACDCGSTSEAILARFRKFIEKLEEIG